MHVVYGLVGFKIHCKSCLVVRREGRRIRRYAHLGTGNYNPTTARIYTDLGLFTWRPALATTSPGLQPADRHRPVPGPRKLLVAPFNSDRLLQLIEREAENARGAARAHHGQDELPGGPADY